MQVSIYRRGRVWWARWTTDGKKCRRSLETDNRKIAKELQVRLEKRLLLGDEPKKRPKVPMAKLRAEYETWSKANKRPRTVMNDTVRIRAYVDFAGVEFVEDVTTGSVMKFMSHRAMHDSVAPATQLRCREILHALMNFAVRLGYVEGNAVSAVPRPRIPERDTRFLSLDEIDELLVAVEGDPIAPLVATAVYAGLRREELCWLTWEDLDDSTGRLVLRIRAKTVGGESWLPKTKRNRVVPASCKLSAVLGTLQQNGVPWVFPSPNGCRWDPDNLSRRFRQLMRKAGLPWNLLELRHTFGSQLARKGTSLLKISHLMGNSPEIARRHYIQLIPEEMAADVEF